MTRREINDMEDVAQERLYRFMIFCQWFGLAIFAGLIVAGLLWG